METREWSDPFLKPEFLDRWTRRLPDARVTRYDCGHFVPEEISLPLHGNPQ